MVGFPGSGKTTWAEKNYPTFYRASQDDLGSRGKFFEAVEKHLKEGKGVVADRCNHTKKHRAALIQLARRYNVGCEVVWVATPHKKATQQLRNRDSHPTISPNQPDEFKLKIYRRFGAEFETPTMKEDFDSLEVIGPADKCKECNNCVVACPFPTLCPECLRTKRGENNA
jgi:tRNA uridine 5-carbamoylmethylation protein Kti12